MPFVIGETEYKLALAGVKVATLASSRYRCPKCALGELRLTREIDLKGNLGPAFFECNAEECEYTCILHGDAATGAVFPNGFNPPPDPGAPGKSNRTQTKPGPGFNRNWGSGWE